MSLQDQMYVCGVSVDVQMLYAFCVVCVYTIFGDKLCIAVIGMRDEPERAPHYCGL